jgi:prepilin peptidase CpaA
MVIEPTTAAWFLPFVIPIVIWVAWSDMATMKIPNKAVMALLVVYVVVGLVAVPSFSEYLWRYAHFAVVLVITFLLNLLRLIGAGDAKFVAAMAPFIAYSDAYPFMFLLGGIIIAAFVVHRTVKSVPSLRARVADWESWNRREFPMGFALAPALLIYLLIGLFGA